MTDVREMFATEANGEEAKGSRALAGTAQLTSTSAEIVNEVLKSAENNIELFRPMIAASKDNHGAMDTLIATAYNLAFVDIDFLKALDDETLENMLRSQQSKRSRAKSKTMTMENYRNMMNGAVAENLIRLAMDKAKSAAFGARRVGKTDFSEEDLQELAADQGQLRREIRNVQSKKSIAKSKEGFSEESAEWQQLLAVEEKLKSIRTEWTAEPKPDKTQGALTELLNGVDPTTMKAADLKELLAKVQALTPASAPAEEEAPIE